MHYKFVNVMTDISPSLDVVREEFETELRNARIAIPPAPNGVFQVLCAAGIAAWLASSTTYNESNVLSMYPEASEAELRIVHDFLNGRYKFICWR